MNAQPDGEEAFKPWKCGDAFNFPAMDQRETENNEHWRTVAGYFIKKEKFKCETWKDEVQNLLVFSGLFSAVVTALLVESYKSLQEDPMEALLLQLVLSLNNTGPTSPSIVGQGAAPLFSASASNKRVNALWFLSLVLSLGTALVGIVAQQWVREHLRPAMQGINLHHLPALIHMQSDAFDRWFVPQIFALLPLLLISSLVIFMVGMIDFLWALNSHVAIPAILAISLLFVFLLFTTIIPGIQSYQIHVLSTRKDPTPRAPCPFQSPQSWAFLRFVVFIKRLVRSMTVLLLPRTQTQNFSQALSLGLESLKYGWTSLGMLWLRQRDIDVLTAHHEHYLTPVFRSIDRKLSPHYDTVEALLEARDSECSITDISQLNAVFQCFHDYSALNYGDEANFKSELIHHIQLHLLSQAASICLPVDIIPPGCYREAIDNARLSFMLQKRRSRSLYHHRLTHYHKELSVRLTCWMVEKFSNQNWQPAKLYPSESPITVAFWPSVMSNRNTDIEFNRQFGIQLSHILRQLFEQTTSFRLLQDSIGAPPMASSQALHYSYTIGSVLGLYNLALCSQHDSLLLDIAERLAQPHCGSEYLFLIAHFHVKRLSEVVVDMHVRRSLGLVALLRALKICGNQYNDADIRPILNSWRVAEISWHFVDRYLDNLPSEEVGTGSQQRQLRKSATHPSGEEQGTTAGSNTDHMTSSLGLTSPTERRFRT